MDSISHITFFATNAKKTAKKLKLTTGLLQRLVNIEKYKLNQMAKKLKKWNGTVIIKRVQGHMYISAHSQKEAREIIEKAGLGRTELSYFRNYFHDCWGNPMQGIEPTEPSIWIHLKGEELKQIYPTK